MRRSLTRDRLIALMKEIGRRAPGRGRYRVYLVGGSTAVLSGWREATIDADLHADRDNVFRDIQRIKEDLSVNIEFARPENFVPPLEGTDDRHVFIETFDRVSFYHHDPYAQLLSKVVRGFRKDLLDAHDFVASGMVDPERFRELVQRIPDAMFAKYPALTAKSVVRAVDEFLDGLRLGD